MSVESLHGYSQETFVRPQPITKRRIQEHNPQLIRIYDGKKGPITFVAIAEKVGGTALGSICKKETDTRPKPRRWMGKVGMPSGLLRNNPLSTTSRDLSEMNLDTIREKIAADLYKEFGLGHYHVPKTRLATLPLMDPYTRTHGLALHFAGQKIHQTLRVVAQFEENYQDFQNIKTQDKTNQPIPFMSYLEENHRPPETILTPQGQPVPLIGFLALLAVARVLADTDVIGGSGGNAGVRWVRNQQGTIVAGQTVKIDPGYAFQFTPEEAGPVNWVLNTLKKTPTSNSRTTKTYK